MLMTSILELVMAQHYYNLPADTIVLTICLSVLLWPIAITDFKMHLIPNRMLVIILSGCGAIFFTSKEHKERQDVHGPV